ncbi:PREDICTED: serine/threonine-protein phosphatase 7 long form homolog [Ipomoea nil]|uniref:serine/threonine-protein phosphatase 7 long form homolog n=1 Tax=Ipomoea nil TaxID=35883 RepID=UPI000900F80D|nr:PREDICTED: serine/threonine-protein phosphatase 7 long form homolog [Ipomoea nil]
MANQRVHPGPLNQNLLTFQTRHRSRAIWTDPNYDVQLKAVKYDTVTRCAAVDDERVKEWLRISGFYGISQLTKIQLDHALITALLERWRPEVHAFHMPFGEVGITLQDVEVLFGLKVDGFLVSGQDTIGTKQQVKVMCKELLGFEPTVQFMTSTMINGCVVPEVQALTAESGEEDVLLATRRLIFHLLNGFLFPDTTKGKYKLYFLPYIRNLYVCAEFCWGSAVLGYLYRALCRASEHGKRTVFGCLLLVQIWAWERLPMVRPSGVLPRDKIADYPIAYRWVCRHTWLTVPSHTTVAYRDQLDHASERRFIFTPYVDYLDDLPPYCKAGRRLWTAKIPLIFYHVVEYHHPVRFCRQFNGLQVVPPDVVYDQRLHNMDQRGKSGTDWLQKHGEHVGRWNERYNWVVNMTITDRPQSVPEYRAWYYLHGRRLIGNPMHYKNEGFVQCAASLNEAMHAFNRLRLDVSEVLNNPDADRDQHLRDIQQNCIDMLVDTDYEFLLHMTPEQYFGAPMPDEPFGPPAADRRRDRPNRRGGPAIGGRSRRAVNIQRQAEFVAAAQQEAEADEDEDEDEDEVLLEDENEDDDGSNDEGALQIVVRDRSPKRDRFDYGQSSGTN